MPRSLTGAGVPSNPVSRFPDGLIRPPRKGLGRQADPAFLPGVSIPKTKPSPRQDLTIPGKKMTRFKPRERPLPVSIPGSDGKNSEKNSFARSSFRSARELSCPPSIFAKQAQDRLNFRHCPARKQGHCAEKASAGKEFQPEVRSGFRKGRRADRAPGRAPLQRNDPVCAERTACPPGPSNETRLMIFSRSALASGPQVCFLAEKETAKVRVGLYCIDLNGQVFYTRGR